MRILAGVLIFAAITAGGTLAWRNSSLRARAATYLLLFFTSVLFACVPHFQSDPKTWFRTYYSGILLGGIFSILLHVLPAIVTYHIARGAIRRKERVR